MELADFERVFAVNVNGIFLMSKAVLPVMLKQAPVAGSSAEGREGYGRILNIASISGKEGNAGMLAYSASKAAVIGLTKVMGKDYAHTGITVNAVAPAVVRTAMVDALPESQVVRELLTTAVLHTPHQCSPHPWLCAELHDCQDSHGAHW